MKCIPDSSGSGESALSPVTHCPFCSVQCALRRSASGHTLRPVQTHTVARGKTCRKGQMSAGAVAVERRIRRALLRTSDGLVPVSTERALRHAARSVAQLQALYGRETVGVYGSGALLNEEAYLLGKFARVALRTPYIDYNGRYCMASAAYAMNAAFGLDRGLPFPAEDIADAEFVLLLGANLAECQPTLVQYLVQMRKRGGRLTVVDPRRTRTADLADEHLAIAPGADRQGLVLGLVGAGNTGTLLATFFAGRIAQAARWHADFGIALIPMAVVLLLLIFVAKEAPTRSGAGGLGGFFLPIILGYAKATLGHYQVGFAVLAGVSAIALTVIVRVRARWMAQSSVFAALLDTRRDDLFEQESQAQ